MALTSAIISTPDSTNRAANLPVLCGDKFGCVAATCKWNDAGTWADDSLTDSDYPVTALTDGLLSPYTKPSSAKQVWYLVFYSSAESIIDYMFFHYNTATFDVATRALLTLGFCTDGDGLFTPETVVTTVVESEIGTGESRHLFLDFAESGDPAGTQRRYSGAKYWRLKFDATGGYTHTPQVNECWFGRQQQLASRPLRPFAADGQNFLTTAADFRSDGGVLTRYKMASGIRKLAAKIPLLTTAQITKMKDFWSQCDYGVEPFIWCETPGTTPAIIYHADDPGEFPIEETDYGISEVDISATEQGGSPYSAE